MTEIAYELPTGEFESIVFDAAVTQNPEYVAEVTEHPVEVGADVADHVRKKSDRLTMECVVSNTPIRAPASIAFAARLGVAGLGFEGVSADFLPQPLDIPSPPTQLNVSGLVNAGIDFLFPQSAQAQVLTFSGEIDRVRAVDARLRELMDTGTLIWIFTSLRDYESMEIVRYTPTRDAASGDALHFVIEFQQVRVASTETVAAPPEQLGRRRRGARAGGETSDAEHHAAEDAHSFLVGAFGSDAFRRAGESVGGVLGL